MQKEKEKVKMVITPEARKRLKELQDDTDKWFKMMYKKYPHLKPKNNCRAMEQKLLQETRKINQYINDDTTPSELKKFHKQLKTNKKLWKKFKKKCG